MIYDELSVKIDELDMWISLGQIHKDSVYAMATIIRKIVELHKLPKKSGGGQIGRYCTECGFPYPCPTIEAIEKELF